MLKLIKRRGSRVCAAIALIAVFASAIGQAPGATYPLQEGVSPTSGYTHQDVLIRSDNGLGDTKQGAGAGLLVGAHPGSGTTPAPGYLHSLIEFDLSPIAASIGTSTINNVSLTIWSQSTTMMLPRVDGSPKVDIHSYGFPVLSGTGINPGSTWNDPDGDGNPATGDTTPGGTIGAFLGTFGELTGAGTLDHTISGGAGSALVVAVQAALASNQKLGLILIEDQADTADRDIAFFRSSATNGATFHPLLIIETASASHAGDFDSDGDVDGVDFVTWQSNFPKASGAVLTQGDGDGDGDVDGADFVVWQTNFPFTPGSGASPVPEPGSLFLSFAGIVCLLLAERLRRGNR